MSDRLTPARTLATALSLGMLLLALPAGAARPVTVRCEVGVSTYSWEPLPPSTIKQLVRGRTLQVITRSGKLTLLGDGGETQPDLMLTINARIIEDAQQFSVFISAVPRRQDRAGSLATVATLPINQKDYKAIQAQMERTADEAAAKVEPLLTPYLDLLGSEAGGEQAAAGVVPIGTAARHAVDFAAALRLAGGAASRGGSFDQLAARAQKESSARLALAHCAQATGERGERLRCVDALAQLARSHASAQRALTALLFQPPPERGNNQEWKEARRRAFRVTGSFSGAALDEAVQAWLYLLASDHSDDYHLFGGAREDYLLLETVSNYLAARPQVPNLDLALARCAMPSRKGQPPNGYCLRVMKSLPLQRRLGLLYTQLSENPVYSFYDPWKAWLGMLETVIDRNLPLHPAVEELCMRRIQRSFWAPDRRRCLEALGRQGKPSVALLQFLADALLSSDEETNITADEAVDDLVRRGPALCPELEKALGPAVARGAYPIYYPARSLPRGLHRCRAKDAQPD